VVGDGQAIGADAGRRVRRPWSLFCVWQHSAATWPKVLPSLSASTALMLTVTAESHGGSASERSNSAALGVRLPKFAASRDLCPTPHWTSIPRVRGRVAMSRRRQSAVVRGRRTICRRWLDV
jgi:hypothetical protein